jgi:hypothetical protein
MEVLVGATILLIVVTSLYALYGDTLKASRMSAQYSAAERYLLGQMDQLRNCGWLTLSGSMPLPGTILLSPTCSSVTVQTGSAAWVTTTVAPEPVFSSMSGLRQTLSVYAVPSPTTTLVSSATNLTLYYTVTQTGDASTRVTTQSSNFSSAFSQKALAVSLGLQWSSGGRSYTKQCNAILSQAQASSQ